MNDSNSWDLRPINKITRSEYACDDGWIRDFLGKIQVGHVATQRGDQPFITPVVYWYDPDTHEIYYHTNIVGRLRKNSELNPKVCFEVSRTGMLLPSNIALEFGIQYESVIIFGKVRILEDPQDQRCALNGLIRKYFPDMEPGKQYRPITDMELKRTSVFAIAIESWSGKRNWHSPSDQSADWPPLKNDSGRTWKES